MCLRLLLVLLLIPTLSWATVYQIGSDVTDDYVSWTAMQVAVQETAGDTVSFRKGDTFNETIVVPDTGTIGNIITYTSHGTGNLPIIDAQDTRSGCITAVEKDYITIRAIDTRNSIYGNIQISRSKNTIIENTIVTGTHTSNHGIVIGGATSGFPQTGYASTADVRYNYIATGDDCIWFYNTTDLTGVKMYGNVCFETGDDCWDLRASGQTAGGYVANNTCINPTSSCLDSETQSGGTTSGTYINNICVTSRAENCDAGEGCFLYMPASDPANYTIENNIYYDTTGSGNKRFYYDALGASGQITFTSWQGIGSAPDQLSQEADPLIDYSYYYITGQGSPTLNAGQDMCDTIDGYLEMGSTWTDDNITVFTPCPASTGNEWNIGAYGTRGECPVAIKY